jgi:anti-sigma B factor antagonist
MSLDVRTEDQGDLVVVTLGGELDIYTVNEFRAELENTDPSSRRLAVDLTDVSLLDSSGLGALVGLLRRARRGEGTVGLVCPSRRLRRVFDITGLRREFVFADDLAGLRAALAAQEE